RALCREEECLNMQLAPSTLAQWVGAIATSAAVIVALFKDELLRYFRRPTLRVRIMPEPPDCLFADSEGWRSAFRADVDHDSEGMPISVPKGCRSVLRL